jgi:predicted nucleotidyltransferase
MGYEEIIIKSKQYSDLILTVMHPDMIVLYGSYSKGQATEESDIDIAVIQEHPDNLWLEQSHLLYKLRRSVDTKIEPVLLYAKDDPSGFCASIMNTGVILYPTL